MLYDCNETYKERMLFELEDGREVDGWFFDGARIDPETLPEGSYWYQTRHSDSDWSEPISIVQGCVAVNFCGTFVCDVNLALKDETEIIRWNYVDA